MGARSKIMMVLSNRRKQLVQNMMWVAQDRPKNFKSILMQMSSNEGWQGGKYPCLVAFVTTEFSLSSLSIYKPTPGRGGIGKA